MLEKRYAFDLEFLVIARSLGFKRIFEAPVHINYRFSSQVNPGTSVGIALDTLAIFYRHYLLNTYRRSVDGAGTDGAGGRMPPAAVNGRSPRPVDLRESRVLLINWRDLEHPDAGGAELFAHQIARRWVEQGHEVTLLSSGFPGGRKTTEIDGVHIRRVGRLRNGSFHAGLQRELARVRGYDVVVESINTLPFLTPLWRRRLPPTIALVHQLALDVWDAELPRPMAHVGRRVERTLLRLYRDVPAVAVSESTRSDLLGLGFSDVRVVPPGREEPPDVRDLPKAPVPTFLFAGRLTANKRPDHAVAAFNTIKRELPLAQLWVIGSGPLERQLREESPADVSFLGRLPRHELFERMARAHGLLVPSVREGWGLVVVEANSVGTPAVGYDVGGLRDSIRDGETGLLATAGDPASLGAAAISLVADGARYTTMREAAIAWAERFSWEATADELLDIAAVAGSRHASARTEQAFAGSAP